MDQDISEKLKDYHQKRNFSITSEPKHNESSSATKNLIFVIQKHWASSLHYDFRLELNGTLKSWAVPKGPSLDPNIKRLAVEVEDHPVSYANFEGTIPKKQYGSGKVIVWDEGYWIPLGDAEKAYQEGNLKFQLVGHKLQGNWALVRIKNQDDKQQPWLLIKENDQFARKQSEYDVVVALADSVKTLPKIKLSQKATQKKLNEFAYSTLTEIDTTDAKSTVAILKKSGAIVSKLPTSLQPQLATLTTFADIKTELDKNWIYEIKYDGYRILVRVDGENIQLFSRNGIDWTNQLKELVNTIKQLNFPSGFYDGELVVNDDKGMPSFGLLQKAFEENATDNAIIYLFDMPFYAGLDVRKVPLLMRKMVLANLLSQSTSSNIQYSVHHAVSGKSLLDSACKLGLEGVIAKQVDSVYNTGRSSSWLKLKCANRQEFIVVGYTKPSEGRKHFGALVLGVYDQGELVQVGSVGSGFTAKELIKLKSQLDHITSEKSHVKHPKKVLHLAQWVKPEMVVEVSFSNWTEDGNLRQPVYKGIRLDKKAADIVKETPQDIKYDAIDTGTENLESKSNTKYAGDRVSDPEKNDSTHPKATKNIATKKALISHPERVIDETGITKADLFDYYQLAADKLFPHVQHRAVALLRAPEGVNGETFLQKHTGNHQIKGLSEIITTTEKEPRIAVSSKSGILNAVQMNVIEFHTENNAYGRHADFPDRIIFDLDPGEGLPWKKMQEATVLMHQFLQEIGLPNFIKTSGGKGFHLVIPIKPTHQWETIRTLSEIIAKHVVSILPAKFVAISGPRNRKGKIFIDFLRNGSGSTTVSAWSARARNGLGVSVPIHFDEVMEITAGDHWTIKNVQNRIEMADDPWQDYATSAVDIESTLHYFIQKD